MGRQAAGHEDKCSTTGPISGCETPELSVLAMAKVWVEDLRICGCSGQRYSKLVGAGAASGCHCLT